MSIPINVLFFVFFLLWVGVAVVVCNVCVIFADVVAQTFQQKLGSKAIFTDVCHSEYDPLRIRYVRAYFKVWYICDTYHKYLKQAFNQTVIKINEKRKAAFFANITTHNRLEFFSLLYSRSSR